MVNGESQIFNVFENTQLEIVAQLRAYPFVGGKGVHPPVGRAGGERLDEGEPLSFHLVADRFFDLLFRVHEVFRAVHRHPCRKSNPLQLGEEFRHPDGCAVLFLVPAVGGGGGLLPHQGGASHLAAGHAVGGVVDEEHRDVLAPVGGVDDLGGADGSQIAVPLVGKDEAVGTRPLHAGCDSRGTAVGGLNHVYVEIAVEKNGASHGGNTDGAALHAKLVHRLGDQPVDR